ncbi:hypothetical protein, partial [Enterococcus faecalis]|uniref:hypothetical protein n=1 Tax=Enterococcus faecalis TaxID=1351 RepID=UPI001E2F831E
VKTRFMRVEEKVCFSSRWVQGRSRVFPALLIFTIYRLGWSEGASNVGFLSILKKSILFLTIKR